MIQSKVGNNQTFFNAFMGMPVTAMCPWVVYLLNFRRGEIANFYTEAIYSRVRGDEFWLSH